MPDITLQMSFDSSFIDFNIESADKFLHKVSLLSVGNSYDFNESTEEAIAITNNLDSLRNFLLPWNNKGSDDNPTHLRAWCIAKSSSTNVYEIKGAPQDFPITQPVVTSADDSELIKDYYLTQIGEQVQSKEDLSLKIINEIEIQIDEDYSDNSTVTKGKVHSVIAQMAQKLFPYNEQLGFLYLCGSGGEVDFEQVKSFYNKVQDNVGIVFFPISTVQTSIWYVPYEDGNKVTPILINENNIDDLWTTLLYSNKSTTCINGFSLSRIAYTKPTLIPSSSIPGNNVTLRRDGKYVGEVEIMVEQDNDWKVNFTAELAKVLDLRTVFLEGNTIKNILVDSNSINNVFDSFLTPFLNLNAVEETTDDEGEIIKREEFWLSIKKLIIDTAVSKSTDHTKVKTEIEKAQTACKSYLAFIKDNILNAPPGEKLKLIVSQLFLQDEDLFSAVYVDAESLKNAIQKLQAAFLIPRNQAILLSLLAQVDFSNLSLPIVETIKIENETIVYQSPTDSITRTIIPIIDIFNFDIFYLFNSYLLHYGKINGDAFLTYVLVKDSFNATTLKDNIPQKIYNIYCDTTNEIELQYGSSNKVLAKQTSIDRADLQTVVVKNIESFAKDQMQPTNVQIPIRVQIGNPNQLVPALVDDLADELSGYVLLSTRAKEINKDDDFNDWKHHNWTKVRRNMGGKLDKVPLQSSFLLPSYLPIENQTQKIFLEISNEKSSLVSSLEKLNESVNEVSFDNKSKLIYLLDKDSIHNPYGLLYGYHYQFAAFAILNSGVLPEVLRKDSEVLNVFKEKDFDLSSVAKQPYHYLRTKKVSSPNIKIVGIKAYPKELNPLYPELFGEGEGQTKTTNDLIVVGDSFNDSFSIRVEKPRTSFWDCYSFVHDGSSRLNSNIGRYRLLDLVEDNLPAEEQYKRYIDYIDPAVSDKFYIEIENKFSMDGNLSAIEEHFIEYDSKAYGNDNQLLNLDKCSKKISVKLDPKTTVMNSSNDFEIILKPGAIYSVKFYNLIEAKYFSPGEDYKFHKCLYELYDLPANKVVTDERVDYYKIASEEQIIETASELNPIKDNLRKDYLWNRIEFSEVLSALVKPEGDLKQSTLYVNLNIDEPNNFAVYSRVLVAHQCWDWNGRQMNINPKDLLNSLNPDTITFPTQIPTTSKGMEFDAWAFADRQDSSSVFKNSRITASLDEIIIEEEKPLALKNSIQTISKYPGLIDNHAMYFRYTIELFNRYESLGVSYKGKSAKSILEVEGVENPWKRYLKPSKRTDALPIPAIRFYIPLTNSIKEANDIDYQVADTMLVLDDVWYKEAGLAQKLTLGIQIGQDPNTTKTYPEAGFDPTLSKIKTQQIPNKNWTIKDEYLLVDDKHLKGPFGFTFDFNATNSKINSSSFIISGDGLTSYIGNYNGKQDYFWPMFKLAARTEILSELHEEDDIKDLMSKWSSPQWVQFMKAVDSFIPTAWRNEVRTKGTVIISDPKKDISLLLFNQFGETFWQYHNWYLIFSTVESNIGGLPIENYYDTFIVNHINSKLSSLNSVHSSKDIKAFTEGYVRIMVVRKSDDYDISKTSENIWNELFGDGNKEKIKEDNTLAMPILSERIPIKIKP